eukprot:TRINITY_DN2779_c0_g1_i1.p1 TRINITY_DN2779_c0_g1~~TRINITY_DN2779_c0_g1_i1.p1  ORF type:complete len:624 (-),score=153.66 TRINITY_DN2779_c0_g1_i1:73-1911(-)
MPELTLKSVIGYSGSVKNGLIQHPNGKYVFYPLGSNIIKKTGSNNFTFFRGHTDEVTCLSLSNDGRYLASGQRTNFGFQSTIIVWDIEQETILFQHDLHKSKVQDLKFSCDDQYLYTLGGVDDNSIGCWNAMTGQPIASQGFGTEHMNGILMFNRDPTRFITYGRQKIFLWQLDPNGRRLLSEDINTGKFRRVFSCGFVEEDDSVFYVGTESGDIFCINTSTRRLTLTGPQGIVLNNGITSLLNLGNTILLGSGIGELALLVKRSFKLALNKLVTVNGAISSLSKVKNTILVGTQCSSMYALDSRSVVDPKGRMEAALLTTAHTDQIYDLTFPRGMSNVVLSTSNGFLQVWNIVESTELLRIAVPNLICHCACFSYDGSAILSGWADGAIRAFAPQSGSLLWEIPSAHEEVRSLEAPCADMFITGGKEGSVRVWTLTPSIHRLKVSLKAHSAAVNSICTRNDLAECITSSDDGSVIIWDLINGTRKNQVMLSTYFKTAVYSAEGAQMLTGGSDKKIVYWDMYSCDELRDLDGCDHRLESSLGVNSIAVSPDDEYFVSGAADSTVRLFNYDSGKMVAQGVGHSSSVNVVRFSPDGRYVVSGASDGSLCIWEYN